MVSSFDFIRSLSVLERDKIYNFRTLTDIDALGPRSKNLTKINLTKINLSY